MTFIIASASEDDAPLILALLQRCELPTGGVSENIRAFAVARSGGVVIGASGVERYGSCGLLRSIVVEPSSRKCGVAAALVERAVLDSERDGLVALYLLTTTAKAYFERREFIGCPRNVAPPGIRESWEFRTGCPDSAVFMRRAIGSR